MSEKYTPEILTIGETMAVMVPQENGPLRYVRDYRLKIAGAESNTAIGLAKLGHASGWISCVGADEMGEFIRNTVRAEGVETSRLKVDPEHPTGLMLKQFSSGVTSVFYYRDRSAASCMEPGNLDWDYMKETRVIHITGITPVLSESCLRLTKEIFSFARRNHILLSFDPNIRRRLWKDHDYTTLIRGLLFDSDIAMLGKEEAQVLLGTEDSGQVIEMLRDRKVRWIAVKDGERGAWVADEKASVFILPAPCRPVDPVGAGDAFNAGFLTGILELYDLEKRSASGCGSLKKFISGQEPRIELCGRIGAIAGACATETAGDYEGYPSREELLRRLSGEQAIER